MIEYSKTIRVECPHCGHMNEIDDYVDGFNIAPCDTEEDGGCDTYFAFHIGLVPHIRTYVLTEAQKE